MIPNILGSKFISNKVDIDNLNTYFFQICNFGGKDK